MNKITIIHYQIIMNKNWNQSWFIHCDIKDINYLLSNNINIEHVSNIIFNLSKKCEYFNRQMFNEKVNELFIIETVIMIKNYKKELLIKNTKLFNNLILNIFSLFN